MNDLNIRFDIDKLAPQIHGDSINIPILGPISIDFLVLGSEFSKDYSAAKGHGFVEIAKNLISSSEKTDKLYALEVIGNSLIDAMINDGDIVVLKEANDVQNGEMAAIRLSDELLLRYFYKEENWYRLQPANPEMKPIYVKKNEPIEIIGKVIMVIRK